MKRFIKADLPEDLGKIVDVVGLFQTVQLVEHKAKLAVAVLRQRIAPISRHGRIVSLAQFRISKVFSCQIPFIGEEDLPAVKKRIHEQRPGECKVAERLQRHKVAVFITDHVDAVSAQIQQHSVAAAIKGGVCHAFEQFRLSFGVEARLAYQVQQRADVARIVQKPVVIVEIKRLVLKVSPHVVSVFPCDCRYIPVGGKRRLIILVCIDILLEDRQHFRPGLEVDPGEILRAIDKVNFQCK